MFFFACADEGVTIEERVDAFLNDLNSNVDRLEIYKNLHDDIDDPYKLAAAWGGYFAWANEPFTFTITDYGSSPVNGFVHHGNYLTNVPLIIELSEEETDNWKITKVTVDGTQRIPVP